MATAVAGDLKASARVKFPDASQLDLRPRILLGDLQKLLLVERCIDASLEKETVARLEMRHG